MVEDTEDVTKFDGLEKLVDKLFEEYTADDHLLVFIDGQTVKGVRFYIARGLFSLKEMVEYKDIVGLEHGVFCSTHPDKFKVNEDGEVFFVEK